jgi:insertion element IS1 protein InsB
MRKKAAVRSHVSHAVVEGGCPQASTVEVRRVEAAQGEERWSFVGSKAHQCWVWQAIDPLPGVALASGRGTRAGAVFAQVHALLPPFGIVHFYPEAAGVYKLPLPVAAHAAGKRPTRQSERNPLPWRTRLTRVARKTICLSKSGLMHAVVSGLFVNR